MLTWAEVIDNKCRAIWNSISPTPIYDLTIASAILFAVMSRARAFSLNTNTTDAGDLSCEVSIMSSHTASQTDTTSPSPSPHRYRSSSGLGMPHLYGANDVARASGEQTLGSKEKMMYCGIYVQEDDVVGQYLARRDAHIASMEALRAPVPQYVSEPAGYPIRGHQFDPSYESHADGSVHRWYPDPETIRHLHALHPLLPHIQPERKLNALSGPEIDIIDGNTSQVLYSAAPKKLLVLFLGREVVKKFIRTFAREDNEAWRGAPTEQKVVLESKTTSAAALKILVSWMKRACTFATMQSMKPLRIPNNLFVACSLAKTLEMFRLHRDAYRLDVAITQQFSSERPVFAVEIETMWRCLGEDDKYVYACIRALGQRMSEPRVVDDLKGLSERYPVLWSRLSNPRLNELCKPHFGREWFERMGDRSNGFSHAAPEVGGDGGVAVRPILPSNHRPGLEKASDQSPQVLNPSAPPFTPTYSGNGDWS
jgi:hypothetical protein